MIPLLCAWYIRYIKRTEDEDKDTSQRLSEEAGNMISETLSPTLTTKINH